jgi:hypothetical protein
VEIIINIYHSYDYCHLYSTKRSSDPILGSEDSSKSRNDFEYAEELGLCPQGTPRVLI